MTTLSGSGSATNSGIDYQQRVASFLLAHLLLDLPISELLEIQEQIKIEEVSFETASRIDDIEVKFSDGTQLLIQAKRRINLSSSKNSQFYSVIEQFVDEYTLSPGKSSFYVLATSYQTSSKIIYDLRKIMESVQANDRGFINNPLNQSEKETLRVFLSIARKCFKRNLKRNVTDDEIYELSKKVKIIVFDVEQGMGLEKAILTVLAAKTQVNPNLVWAALIKNSIYFSSKRLSVNRQGLLSRFGKYLNTDSDINISKENEEELLKWEIELTDKVSSAREVLLIESFAGDYDYMLVEFIRFNEDCSKRLSFKQNQCILSDGTLWSVVYRCSTYEGMQRLLEKKQSDFQDKRVVIIPVDFDEHEDIENTPCSTLYSEICNSLIFQNTELLKCLHCDKSISGVDSILVEIDELDLDHLVGCIHLSCLQPVNRVVGRIESQLLKRYNCLKKFDFQLWVKQIQKGQHC